MLTSIEVIEHSRPAPVTWVEQQVTKHRYLPTNRLVLVSKSGFTQNALTAVAAQGGWVAAMQPEVVEVDGEPVVEHLYLDQIELIPTQCRLHVVRPDNTAIMVEGIDSTGACTVFDEEGTERGSALQLSTKLLSIDWVREHFVREAHNHPERDKLKGFSFGTALDEFDYHLSNNETDELHPVMAVDVDGTFSYVQTELAFTATELADRRFGVGEGLFLGRPTVWVQTKDEQAGTAKLSWRTKDDAPLRERPAGDLSPHFPELSRLRPPVNWPPATEDGSASRAPGPGPGPHE